MGGGIAQTAAQADLKSFWRTNLSNSPKKGKSKIAGQLKKLVEKGKMAEGDTQKTS